MRNSTWLVIPAIVVHAACGWANRGGYLGSTTIGNVGGAPVAHGSPLAELHAACGPGALTRDGSAVIRRQPYLQNVTTTKVMIGWVTTHPAGERVEVTTVDGAPVVHAEAEVEQVGRKGKESQVWAEINGLAPDTSYCYQLTTGTALSGRIGFRTAPPADTTRRIRFLAFGDSGGGGAEQRALLAQMYRYPYDLIVHTGDLAYDMGTIKQFDSTVFGMYGELLRSIPLFPAAGNHEYRTMRGAPFREVFALPGGEGDEQWYSYDWGRIHFAVLDTEASYPAQAAWLARDLAGSSLPWKIVYMHRPPYSSGYHGSDRKLRSAIEPVLDRYGVQLVLAGHDHDYERILPQHGVEYVVTGGGGVGTRAVGRSSFTAFSDQVIHFLYVDVGLDELVVHAIDANGAEFDSTVVPRTPGAAVSPAPVAVPVAPAPAPAAS